VFGSPEHLPYGECGEATARAIFSILERKRSRGIGRKADKGKIRQKNRKRFTAPLPLRALGAIRPLATKTKTSFSLTAPLPYI